MLHIGPGVERMTMSNVCATRVMVTGGTGFIGSHLVELCLARGWEVVCPVRNVSALRHLAGLGAEVVSLDQLESAVTEGPHIQYVMHLAGATRALDYQGYRKVNVEYPRRLLELFSGLHTQHFPDKFVLVSSQAAAGPAGPDGTPVKESDPPRPVSLYGRSKLEAEQVAATYMDKLPITIVRPPTVFGPRDTDVLGVFRSARFRIAPRLWGPDRLVSIIYVEDLVRGILQAAVSPASAGETFFLANPEPVVWREFTVQVAHTLGYRAISLPIPVSAMKLVGMGGDLIGRFSGSPQLVRSEKVEEMKQIAWACSVEKAAGRLGWKASIPLDRAIAETGRWYRENGWI